jgi:N utilization substance protein B
VWLLQWQISDYKTGQNQYQKTVTAFGLRAFLMKTARDPRHLHRIKIVKQLFAHSFKPVKSQDADTNTILADLAQIDQKIEAAAPEWPLPKVAKIDLAILRLAVFELTHKKETPQKVTIDEAVELAKEFGTDSSPAFVNGVLGTIVKGV